MLIRVIIAATALATALPAGAQSFAELRGKGICNVGRVIGNADGDPIWPQVCPQVAECGDYYNTFVRMTAPGESDDLAAYGNVALYNECR